jgi:lipopolysaccharide cholinephosphotransferase
MNATQKYLVKLLLEIDEICKENEIEYFIDYGTTLGAVRHEGFVPWDDDIDIMMTENNYNKWVKVCEKTLDKTKRVFLDGRLDRSFPAVFGRYHDVETTRVGKRTQFWEPTCGQCIDVFCLMELPKNPILKKKAIDRYYAYDEYANSSYRHYRLKTDTWMKLYRRYTFWGKIFGKNFVLKMLEKKIFNQHYVDCDTYMVASARIGGPSSFVPKEYYDTYHLANFEGHQFKICGKYIECLNVYYEDTYCMIPEQKKSHSKMSFTFIPCADYVADYMRLVDKKELLADRQKFKDIAVEEGYMATKWSREYYVKLGYLELLKIQKKIKSKQIVLEDYLDAKNREKLAVVDDIFSSYYSMQMNKSVRSWVVYFDIGNELLYAAIYNLIYYRNDFYSVAKILNLRELNGIPMTLEIQELWNIVLIIRKVKAETIYGHYKLARDFLNDGLNRYADSVELQLCKLNLDVIEAKSSEELQECENTANDLLEKYPNNDQCMKYLGDIYYKRQELQKADEYYKWVMENSQNGMLHLDIRRKRGKAS